jgi:hypothetical protein
MMYEEIPMDEPYRQQLKDRYTRPLQRNTIVISIFVIGILLAVGVALSGKTGSIFFLLLLLIPFGYFIMSFYSTLSRHNLHFYKDAEFGFIIKEQMTISKVFHTPAGINIYWLESDDIKTFTPNPYQHFHEGDQVFIYYLKYSKEYLAYEQ